MIKDMTDTQWVKTLTMIILYEMWAGACIAVPSNIYHNLYYMLAMGIIVSIIYKYMQQYALTFVKEDDN